MHEISEAEARKYLLSGQAGYWSIHKRSVPIEHDKMFVIRLRGKCWLVDAEKDDFKVSFVGYAGVLAGREKGAFSVQCGNDEIVAMAQQEMKDRGVQLSSEGMKEVPDDVLTNKETTPIIAVTKED